jgi:hypothetical protein
MTQSTPATPGFPATDIAFNHRYTENIARVGVNYRFGARSSRNTDPAKLELLHFGEQPPATQ